jgi:hypothetical protein
VRRFVAVDRRAEKILNKLIDREAIEHEPRQRAHALAAAEHPFHDV